METRQPKLSPMTISLCCIILWGWPVLSDMPADASSEFESELRVSIQAVIVSNDNGQRAARVTPRQFSRWVDFANRTFQAANIHFDFAPTTSITYLKSSIMNRVTGTRDSNWKEAKRLGNKIAAEFSESIVVFCRYGPGEGPTGAGFSWTDYNFIVMPGFMDARHCGHDHLDALAHEIGHYLGLPHTFVLEPFKSTAEAEAYLQATGGKPSAFDGDGFLDTPPDPSIRSLECDRIGNVKLGGMTFRLPRWNIMSYYDERDRLSPMQIHRARWVLRKRIKERMALPRNTVARSPIEAESLEITTREGCKTAYQPMTGFGIGDWSDEAQLFVNAHDYSSVQLVLPVLATGSFHLNLYATQAPDFCVIKVVLDDQVLADALDLYAPIVLPTGRISLGIVRLAKGKHHLTFTSVGRNEASTGFRFGIDCIELIP